MFGYDSKVRTWISSLNIQHRRQTKLPPDPIRWEVLQALKESGCPICRVQRQWSAKFYYWLFAQNYYAGTMPEELKRSGGLCYAHAKKLLEIRSVYVTSVMYDYLTQDVLDKLQSLAEEVRCEINRSSHKPYHFSITPTGECPACVEERKLAERALSELVAALDQDKVAEDYRASDALCMPHFHCAVEQALPHIVLLLAETQITKLSMLKIDFAEYFRKVDYRFANEPKGNEKTTWERAIRRFVGEVK